MTGIDNVARFAQSSFTSEPDEETGTAPYYVNQYWQDREGTTRRETIFDGLSERQADKIERELNRAAKQVRAIVAKYGGYAQ